MENDNDIKEPLTEENNEAPEKKSGKEIALEIWNWVKPIVIGVFTGVFLVVFVCQRNNIIGPSMFPTLKDKEMVLIEKISTYFDNFDRGDIVVLDGSNMEGYNHEEGLVKRIVGLPGETLVFRGGSVYIKKPDSDTFELLEEPYLPEGIETYGNNIEGPNGFDEITLGPDEYFCMGDNRGISNDSRYLGPFSADRIKGIVFVRIYPFSEFGKVE